LPAESHRRDGVPLIKEFRASLRQLCFPYAFRIPRPQEGPALLEEADSLLTELVNAVPSQRPGAATDVLSEELLARFATGVWRLRQRMIDPGTGQPTGDSRRAYRHVESLWDTLAEFGVEIHDHAGEPFDSGTALVVLSYERDPAATREVVKETVKPTVYFHERCIQRGEVIVGSPEA
jgi:hypothetical protein